jgi:CO dehydrogenase/acetyl-CoA synthase beta subunit
MIHDQDDNDMTSSAIINSLSLSHSKKIINNTNEMTVDSNSPIISDMEENIAYLTNNAEVVMLDPETKQNVVTRAELLASFDECEGGDTYVCKLCQSVRNSVTIILKQRRCVDFSKRRISINLTAPK